MIREDDYVDIVPDAIVHENGSINVGRLFAGHKSIVIVVKEYFPGPNRSGKVRVGLGAESGGNAV